MTFGDLDFPWLDDLANRLVFLIAFFQVVITVKLMRLESLYVKKFKED